MSNAYFGWNNYTKTATLTAGATANNFSVNNLKDDRGAASLAWQTPAGVTTSAGGATVKIAPLVRQTWRMFGVFRSNLTPLATCTVQLFNNPNTLVATLSLSTVVAGYKQMVGVLPNDTAADFAVFNFNDSSGAITFINVPLIFAGAAWKMGIAPGYKTKFGRDAAIDEVVSKGGQEYPIMRWQRRHYDMFAEGVTQSETWAQLDPVLLAALTTANILFIPDATSATVAQEAVYGRLSIVQDITFPYNGADRRSIETLIEERL